jgi:hypothetical protein
LNPGAAESVCCDLKGRRLTQSVILSADVRAQVAAHRPGLGRVGSRAYLIQILIYGKVKQGSYCNPKESVTDESGTIQRVATMTELIRAARQTERAAERASIARAKRDDLVVELHKRGESPKLLAEAIGLSENQIFKILRARREEA